MILLWLECDADGVSEISLETVALARSLSAAGGGIAIRAALFGDVPEAARDQLAAHGVDEVHHVTGPAYDAYAGAAWASALQDIRARTKCVVVAAAGSPRGNEVIAHLAARLDVPMAANVLSFSGLSPFEVTRQVAGGAALEDMRLSQRPALFTVAGHSWTATPADQPTSPTWHDESPEVADAVVSAHVDGPDGPETYSVPTPMVATVLEGGVEPRYPTLKGRMAAKKVEIENRSATGTPVGSSRTQLHLPPPAPSSVEILGEGPEAAPAIVDLFEKLGVH